MYTIFDGGSISGIIDGFAADLAASSALAGSSAAAAGQFEVDLAALYNHHADVLRLYDRMQAKAEEIGGSSLANSCIATSPIDGVSESLSTTVETAVGGGMSGNNMFDGIRTVIGQIAAYADAVAAVYLSYVHADTEGATDLTVASNPGAASVTLPDGG